MMIRKLLRPFLALTILTVLPIVSALANPSHRLGGSDGGGGFEYPNSKLLLKVVSHKLADDIQSMHHKAFEAFPIGFQRNELVAIIRSIVPMPGDYIERTNSDGEEEGLMFDYNENFCDKKGCGPRIIALKPFYESYRSIPVKQLEKQTKKEDYYLQTIQDLRERLLHEASHLLGIAKTPKTDFHGDIFAERVESAMQSQSVVCEAPAWSVGRPNKITIDAFIINLKTGLKGSSYYIAHEEESESNLKSAEQMVLDLVRTAAKNPFNESGGFTVFPLPNNFLGQSKPYEYKRSDDQIKWRTAPDESAGGSYTVTNVDLQTGKGYTRWLDRDYFHKTKEYRYYDTQYDCRVESPVVSLEFK